MKKHVLDFFRRGFAVCGLGPMVLVVLYAILYQQCDLRILSVREVCLGIVSLSALTFVAGGMNAIYQIERLPLPVAILIHGIVLYISYLATYLANGWLERSAMPILVFSCIFTIGYLVIWAVIYSTTKKRTAILNEMLKKKQKNTEDL